MIGYKSDTKVIVIRYNPGQNYEFKAIWISEVTNEDYVRVAYLPNQSFTYVNGSHIKNSLYSGEANDLELSDGSHLFYCKEQKILACDWFEPDVFPIIDEKVLADLGTNDAIAKTNNMWHRCCDEGQTLKDAIKLFKDPTMSGFRIEPLSIVSHRNQLYEGVMYNLNLPIEYALVINDNILTTTLHE